ncbi:MAG: glutamine synthetase III [Bacteroidales bacterium]|nr:glutamine synthetase III [Bacteroidales bacterium]MCF8457396.1 glutamine synthetase III [Bacteroidales bacterium]
MAILRFNAMQEIFSRQPIKVVMPEGKASDYFAENVFTTKAMQAYLSEEAYKAVLEAREHGKRIDRRIANQIASGMKSWAVGKGVTHYTHWFQPLNGATAEKHDAFFEPSSEGSVLEKFDGDMLVQQEPDASSFPSGGIRNTFEARGYTAWDPSSPAFLIEKTLCIPTIFVSYTGEALDYKTPLLKSLAALDKAAVEVCQMYDKNVTKVNANLGWEQEYFLVDEALYYARPDLILTGRTLMGHSSAKDQQLEDHYFGSIPDRAFAFMQELEVESLRLGIPIKTRHNEVAPNQFEAAPVYEEANLAVDHNQLFMDLMAGVARKHKFRVLLHEKPYKGVNGSGKHNNWSMSTDTGVNLLSPGKTPKKNMQFLTFLVNTVKAVHDHADLIRASIVSPGNEHRLGANEAPPAIISVFLGKHISQTLDDIEARVSSKKMSPDEKAELKLDIGKIPEILLDNTDRNRTSPFAFTGNRFEFRAVGSSANPSSPMIALNTAMANQLREFVKDVAALTAKNIKRDEAIFQVLRKYIVESKKIRFEGNGYGQEWKDEAARRGLSNIAEVPEALKAFLSEKSVALFADNHVLSHRELVARQEIRLENYIKSIQIESRVLGDLAVNHIIPTAIKYQNNLIENVRGLKELFGTADYDEMATPHLQSIKKISRHISYIRKLVVDMVKERKDLNPTKSVMDQAQGYSRKVKPYLESIRYHIDKLELIVDDEIWTLPKYRELLFTR